MDIDWQASTALIMLFALGLGVRHGFDLDHLATIDAISRTVRDNSALSKRVGLLFSLGHGAVVMLISLIAGGGLMSTKIPSWLDACGNWISIGFLFLFGVLNLWNIFSPKRSADPLPAGMKSFLVRRFGAKQFRPSMVMATGALFALSFDTISQVALFSISASLFSGWFFSGLLGLCFMLGMILSDGLNGLLVSLLIQRADRLSLTISRSFGLAISLFSLSIGFVTLYKMLFIE